MILTNIKILLNMSLEDTSKDQILNYLKETITQRVKNYCNLEEVPKELEFILVEMISAIYKNKYATENISSITPTVSVGAIKSETIGDYSVTYATSTDKTTSSNNTVDDVLNDYKSQLNKFRKLKL